MRKNVRFGVNRYKSKHAPCHLLPVASESELPTSAPQLRLYHCTWYRSLPSCGRTANSVGVWTLTSFCRDGDVSRPILHHVGTTDHLSLLVTNCLILVHVDSVDRGLQEAKTKKKKMYNRRTVKNGTNRQRTGTSKPAK